MKTAFAVVFGGLWLLAVVAAIWLLLQSWDFKAFLLID